MLILDLSIVGGHLCFGGNVKSCIDITGLAGGNVQGEVVLDRRQDEEARTSRESEENSDSANKVRRFRRSAEASELLTSRPLETRVDGPITTSRFPDFALHGRLVV